MRREIQKTEDRSRWHEEENSPIYKSQRKSGERPGVGEGTGLSG